MDSIKLWALIVIFKVLAPADASLVHRKRRNHTIRRSRQQQTSYRLPGEKSVGDFDKNVESNHVVDSDFQYSGYKNADVTAELLLSEPRRFRQKLLNEGIKKRSLPADKKLKNNAVLTVKKHNLINNSGQAHVIEFARYTKHHHRRLIPPHNVNKNELIKSSKKHIHGLKPLFKKENVKPHKKQKLFFQPLPFKQPNRQPHQFHCRFIPMRCPTKYFKVPRPSKINVSGKKTDIALAQPVSKKRDFTLSEPNKDVLFINAANNTIRIDRPKHTEATKSAYPGPIITFNKEIFERSALRNESTTTTTTTAPITYPSDLSSIISLQRSDFNSSILSDIGPNVEGVKPEFVMSAIIGAQKKCVCKTDECKENCEKKDNKPHKKNDAKLIEKSGVKEEIVIVIPTSAPLSTNYDTPNIESIMNRNKDNKNTLVGDALTEIVNEEALDVLNRFVSESSHKKPKDLNITSDVFSRANVIERANKDNCVTKQKNTSNVLSEGEASHDNEIGANRTDNNQIVTDSNQIVTDNNQIVTDNNQIANSGDGDDEMNANFVEESLNIAEEIKKMKNRTENGESVDVNINISKESNKSSRANISKEFIENLVNTKNLQEDEDNGKVHKKNTFKAVDIDKELPAVLNRKDCTYFPKINKVNEEEAKQKKTPHSEEARSQLMKFVKKYRQYMNSFYKRVHKITHDPEFWKNISREYGSNSSTKRHLVFGKYKPGPLVRAFLKLSPNYKDVLQNAIQKNTDPKFQRLSNMTNAYNTVLRNAIQADTAEVFGYVEGVDHSSILKSLPSSHNPSYHDANFTSNFKNYSETNSLIAKGAVTGSKKDQMIVSEDTDIEDELVKKEKHERSDPMKTFLLHLLDSTSDPQVETPIVHHYVTKSMLLNQLHDKKETEFGSNWNRLRDKKEFQQKKVEGPLNIANGNLVAPMTNSGVQNLTHNDYGELDLPIDQRDSQGLSDHEDSENEEAVKKAPAFEEEIHKEAEDIVSYDKSYDSEHTNESMDNDNNSDVERKKPLVEHIFEEESNESHKDMEVKNNNKNFKSKSDEEKFNMERNLNTDSKSVEYEDRQVFENLEKNTDPISQKITETLKPIEYEEHKPEIENENPVVEHVYPDNYNTEKQDSFSPTADVEESDQKTRFAIEQLKSDKTKDYANELRYHLNNDPKQKSAKDQEKSLFNKFMHFETDKSYDLNDENQNKDELKYYENQVKLLKKQEKSAFGLYGELAKRVMTPNAHARYLKNESVVSSALVDEDYPLGNSNILKTVPKSEMISIRDDVKTSWVRSKKSNEKGMKKNNTEEGSNENQKKKTINISDKASESDDRLAFNGENPMIRIITKYSGNNSQASRLRSSSLEETGNETDDQSGDEMKEDVSKKLQNSLEYFGEDENLVNDLSAARNESVNNDDGFANVKNDANNNQETKNLKQSNNNDNNNGIPLATEGRNKNKTKSKKLKETSQLYSITVTSENSNVIGGTFDSNDRDSQDITSETKAEDVDHVLKSVSYETGNSLEKDSKRTISKRKKRKNFSQKNNHPSIPYQLNL